jgi:hypothetical protein
LRQATNDIENTKPPDWTNHESHKNFFAKLTQELNLAQPTELSTVTREDVYKYGGQKILQYYGNSLYKALVHCYPNSEIYPWTFDENVPKGFWGNTANHRKFYDWLYTKLKLQSMDDWYKVTVEDIAKNGGGGLLTFYNRSPSSALQSIYPEHIWKLERFLFKPQKQTILSQGKKPQRFTSVNNHLIQKWLQDPIGR